ncbi:MAG: isoprenylcysteine carboxylmethyltransferase family protein [Pseudomonadota bacterium]
MKLLIPPPVLGLLSGAAIWGLAKLIPGLTLSFPGQIFVAIPIMAAGFSIDVISIFAFFRASTTVSPIKPSRASSLVTGGLYRFTRNPMYLGLALLLFGWVIWLGNPLGLLVLAGFIAWMTVFQIKPEEAALKEFFGEEYEAYRARVRRWL